MAIPMSAQQIAEQRAKKRTNAPAAMPSAPAHIGAMPMAAAPQPVPRVATGPAAANKIIPTATPQAAQTKVPGAIPGMVNQATKRPVAAPMSAAQATAKPKTVNAPLNSNITSVRTGDELNQLASDQLAMQRSGLQNAADTQIASLQNSAKYANQLIQDNRVLENGNFERTNAPAAWDGSVGYRGAQLDRGRQIDDTMRAADLSNAMNSVNQDLYNFDSNAAATERGIANELLNNERGYGLNKTASDQSIKESNLNAALQVGNQTGKVIAPQADWQGLVRQANNPDTPQNLQGQAQDYSQMADTRNFNESTRQDNRNFEYTQGRDSVKDAQWQTEFSRIAAQDGIQNAIAWANQSLNQAEFEDSSAYKWAGLDAELASAATEGEKYQGMSANDVVSNVRKNFDDGDGALLTDPASREQMYMQIIGAGLPGDQEDQALAAIGFTPAQIKSLDDKYLGK